MFTRYLDDLMKLNSISLCLLVSLLFSACASKESINWQHLDLKDDGVFGISTDKAYKELLKGKKSKQVLVAVLDAGFDTEHEDLKSNFWINEKEIPDNGIDDDNNGFIDDTQGWNFSGSTKEMEVNGNVVLTCLVRRDQARFNLVQHAAIPPKDREAYAQYQKNKTTLENKIQDAKSNLVQLQKIKIALDNMVKQIGKPYPTLKNFIAYIPNNAEENQARSFLNKQMKRKTFEEFYQEDVVKKIKDYQESIDYTYNTAFIPRSIVSENSDSSKGVIYGNNIIGIVESDHGTHVAGIIGADRNNKLGIQGVAANVRIMSLIPYAVDGRELEKVWAQAIRYAVDNGARVINMSFRELNSWDQTPLDDAIKYAVSKDVLLIRAAGNESANLDSLPSYIPSPNYLEGGTAATWITVGASDHMNDETLRASFSNYGKTKVDVFAPGVLINSTVPGSKYKRLDGTSMATPIVSGLAALIWSYYPDLTAIQVKEIIMQSVIKVDQLKERCVTGGVVNAYTALQLAETYKNK